MAHIKLSKQGVTPFEKLLGHLPEISVQWQQLEMAFFQSNTFDADFLEQIRRVLAFNHVCQYCMAKAGPADENPDSLRLAEALRLANKFALDHLSIDQEEITRLKKYFSDQELVELLAFCSFISAAQKLGASLGLQAANHYSGELTQ
ncbi:carboxymuconolactone decarboxylase family protein [Legionella sp. 29fVS95]|uniref:carboxymuconolactone decarboxylase family protein n=1 Tax=Legionella sp. 29fVS95 TaxID=3402813 RepID=UPI003AF5E99D